MDIKTLLLCTLRDSLRTPKNICPISPNKTCQFHFARLHILILNFQFLILKSAKIIT
jgi:hypothetical protein